MSRNGPDFLVIGAERGGSTWLSKNLPMHPKIWVPPIKSVVYFHRTFQYYRLKKLKIFRHLWMKPDNLQEALWYLDYFANPFTTEGWYKGLFKTPDGILSGEVAEAYSTLPVDTIQKIYRLFPDCKIILSMRDPRKRALSMARNQLFNRAGKKPEDVGMDDFMAKLKDPDIIARSMYTQIIDQWTSVFPKDQVYLCWYDDLRNDPAHFLLGVCHFLGVDFDPAYFKETLNARPSYAPPSELSPGIERAVATLFMPELEELARRYDSYAALWLQEAQNVMLAAGHSSEVA